MAFSDRPWTPRGPKKGQNGPFGATHVKNGTDGLEVTEISLVPPIGVFRILAKTAPQRSFSQWSSADFDCTPLPAPKEIRSVRLLERLEGVQGKEPGSQAPPSNQCNFGGERREFPGSGCNGQGLFASGFQHFSSLLQIPTTISAESSFPTPPPPPSWSHKWSGDWWLVPAGMSTQCASCQLWGPLTPGG